MAVSRSTRDPLRNSESVREEVDASQTAKRPRLVTVRSTLTRDTLI